MTAGKKRRGEEYINREDKSTEDNQQVKIASSLQSKPIQKKKPWKAQRNIDLVSDPANKNVQYPESQVLKHDLPGR